MAYISCDQLTSLVSRSRSQDPSWASRWASARRACARRASVTSAQVPSSRRGAPSGPRVTAPRQCTMRCWSSARTMRTSRSSGRSPRMAARAASVSGTRSSGCTKASPSGLVADGSAPGSIPTMRSSSGDQVTSRVSSSQCQDPTPAICWASANWAALRRRPSSARLRSVISVDTPITATPRPSASKSGTLWVRKIWSPTVSSMSSGTRLSSTARSCARQASRTASSAGGRKPCSSWRGRPSMSAQAWLR